MSHKPKLTVRWLNGNKEVESSLEATHLLIAPDPKATVITIGDRERDNSRHALTFAEDHFRFGRYENPMTDWDAGIHVYAGVDPNSPYHEDAATICKDGAWWAADLRLVNGKATLVLNRKLDPVAHTLEVADQVTASMTARAVPPDRIQDAVQAAVDRELDRAQGDENRIKKHEWGTYHAYGFKIWIAHIRAYADKVFQVLVEPDDKKAWALRNKGINGKVTYQRYIRPVERRHPNEPQTDQPDFASKEEPKPIATLAFPTVKAGKLTGETAEFAADKLVGKMFWILILTGNGIMDPHHSPYTWDPTNKQTVALVSDYASALTSGGKPRYAVELQ